MFNSRRSGAIVAGLDKEILSSTKSYVKIRAVQMGCIESGKIDGISMKIEKNVQVAENCSKMLSYAAK